MAERLSPINDPTLTHEQTTRKRTGQERVLTPPGAAENACTRPVMPCSPCPRSVAAEREAEEIMRAIGGDDSLPMSSRLYHPP